MTKVEFIKKVADYTDITQREVGIVLNAIQDVIKETVAGGDKVALTGFLTFEKKHIEAKSGISRLGGEEKEWKTPEKDIVAVKMSKSYREL